MSIKSLLRRSLDFAALVLLVACASPTPETTQKTYQVNTSSEYYPFEFFNQDNQLIGFDIDLIHEIASRSGFGVEVNHMPWSDLMAEMAACTQDHIYIVACPSGSSQKAKRPATGSTWFIPVGIVKLLITTAQQRRTRSISASLTTTRDRSS